MRRGEEIFTEIVAIRDSQNLTLAEAVVAYAEAADSDVEDVVKALDASAILQIKETMRGSIGLKPSLRSVSVTTILFG